MFSHLRRVPLRQCLHTQARSLPKAKSYRLGFTLTASATVVSYTTWRWTRDQRIALDSVTVSGTTKSPAFDGPSSETHHTSAPPIKSEALADSSTSEAGQTQSETEASDGASQGAYNPVTGEINWDCPCLGGMAYGPCGPEFREAFSCFIYSEEEPKGINCVEKFQAMQTCFRAHPEVYADEIMDDDDGKATEGATEEAPAGASSFETDSTSSSASTPASQVEKSSSSAPNTSA